MTARVVVAAALVVAALVVAAALRRRRPDTPGAGGAPVPAQLDRADFAGPTEPWLVVLFSSRACDSCAGVAREVAACADDGVAVEDVEWSTSPDRHRRYGVEGVPVVVIADATGVTRASFVGSVRRGEVAARLAALRDEA